MRPESERIRFSACRLRPEFWYYIGACAPIPIHHEIDVDDVVIEEQLLEQAARYF